METFQRSLRILIAFLTNNKLDPLPIRRDLKGYGPNLLRLDAFAGVNVALLGIPQGMAYAVIAEVPIHYGISCGAIAAMAAACFSGSRHTIVGPTNATAFMLFSFFVTFPDVQFKVAILPALVFLVGILLTIGAYFRVADLLQYISRSVVVGYLTGAAILIIVNQLRQVLGIDFEVAPGERPRTFFTIAWYLISHLNQVQWQPLVIGLLSAATYQLLLKPLKGYPVFAISLVLMSVTYLLLSRFNFQLETFDAFSLADLKPEVPRFSTNGIFEDIHFLFSVAFSVAFLAALENSTMAKTLASRSGDRPDGNQDMFSLGISNLITSFFSGMPASGSLTRSQLNFSSGAITRFASIFAGFTIAIGAISMAQFDLTTLIPKSALAALVICIAISLIKPHEIRICLRATGSDAAVLIVTFFAALLIPLHVAIFLGVALSIMAYLHKASRPELVEYDFTEQGTLAATMGKGRTHPAISIVHVEGELFFGAAELFRSQIQRTCMDPNLRVIILRMRNAHRLDATSVMALEELVKFLNSDDRYLIVSGATEEVLRVLHQSGTAKVIGEDNIFEHSPGNPNISTRDALKRAQGFLGTKDAEIRIFYDPNQPQPS